MSIVLNSSTILSINTGTTETPIWSRVAAGFKNIATALNEVVYQATYLDGEGWGSSEVTGGQMTITLTGDRVSGDVAQDFIFDEARQFNLGEARKAEYKLETGDYTLTGECTLANITVAGGDASTVSNVSVTIHINGKPTVSA